MGHTAAVRLRTEGRAILDYLAVVLKEFSDHRHFTDGHTDNIAIGGRQQPQ